MFCFTKYISLKIEQNLANQHPLEDGLTNKDA